MGSLGEIPKMRRLSKTSIPRPSTKLSLNTCFERDPKPKSKGVLSSVGWVYVFVLGINRVSDWVYCICVHRVLLFSKIWTPPPPTQHFLKVNNYPHFITDDFKISSIHNRTLFEENNKLGCLSKF